jgi:hypothetical protein
MAEGEMPNNLEQEIAQIERDLASKRAALEQQKTTGEIQELPHEKETLHEVVGERLAPMPMPAPQAPVAAPLPVTPPPADAPSYMSEELRDKVQNLVNVAFTKSLDEAIKEVRATNNAALIDAFHDALVDELYGYLVERGKLKKL